MAWYIAIIIVSFLYGVTGGKVMWLYVFFAIVAFMYYCLIVEGI